MIAMIRPTKRAIRFSFFKRTALILLLFSVGCASMRRHPVVYEMAIGAATGATVALLTRHNCPSTINGVAYDGTPPCPEYWPPTKK